jgi:hypothetical protein
MGNPTIGTLNLSNGIDIANCNPSFAWSEDSRYLAVPQFRFVLGLQFHQRLLVVDVLARIIHASRGIAWYIQPKTFASGMLSVDLDPAKNPRELVTHVPADLALFRSRSAVLL